MSGFTGIDRGETAPADPPEPDNEVSDHVLAGALEVYGKAACRRAADDVMGRRIERLQDIPQIKRREFLEILQAQGGHPRGE
jgi:hypothetical protein